MIMPIRNSRRENFDVSPQQQAEIETLQNLLGSSTKKDALLFAVHLTLLLLAEAKKGNQFYVGDPATNNLARLLVPGLETPNISGWIYLTEQAHPWKRQLFVKGRKLTAASVWSSAMANNLTVEQTADNWELPPDAVREIFDYCESNRPLLELEAAEELRRLEENGVGHDTPNPR